jgi:hypothetical protein
LVDALDGIIEAFSEDIEPYAIELVNQLITSYFNYRESAAERMNQNLN